MLAVLRDPARSAADVELALGELLASAHPGALDLDGRRAQFAARLACALDSLASPDPRHSPDSRDSPDRRDEQAALESAWKAVEDAQWRAWTVYEVADACLSAGRARQAVVAAGFGLEALPRVPTVEPNLWHVRFEAARLLGDWSLTDASLAGLEASLAPRAGEAPLPTGLAHSYRSRLLQARAQGLHDLGLLDLSRRFVEQAIEEAEASGDANTLAAARLQAIDQAMLGSDPEMVRELAEAGLDDERLGAFRPRFRLALALVQLEELREAKAAGADVTALAAEARAAFEQARAGLSALERLKEALWRCDLETLLASFEPARAALLQARERAAELGHSLPVNEGVLLAMHAWRLARQDGSSAAELAAARSGLFAAYERLLEHWASAPRRPGGIGFLHLAWRTQVVSEVIEAELEAELEGEAEGGVARAFERLLEVQAMGTTARERGLARIELGDVGALLAPGRGMLVLLPAQERAHLFVLDSSGLTHEPVPARRSELRARAGRVTAALSNPAGKLEAEGLRALHALLIAPAVRQRMEAWSGAWVIGFDLLRDLPFGVLGGEDGRCYGERLALAMVPSVALAVDLARRPRRPEGRATGRARQELVLVVASDPPEERGLPPFDFGKSERKRWLGATPPEAVTILAGARASLGGLRAARPELARARVLHFVAHGISVPEREYRSALLLSGQAPADEQVLHAEDIAALEFEGLVVLSVCGSGRGPARTGDDRLVSLGGAFLEAGARCVVLARFPVEFEATLALMERFHAALAAGQPPAEALRQARAGLGAEDSLAAFHGAAFEVLGLGFERP